MENRLDRKDRLQPHIKAGQEQSLHVHRMTTAHELPMGQTGATKGIWVGAFRTDSAKVAGFRKYEGVRFIAEEGAYVREVVTGQL